MPKPLAKVNGYKTLVKKITREFAELELFVKNRVAKGYWNVGKYIDEHLLGHKDKADYATGFYEQLAKDVGRERTTLQLSVRFCRAYPIRGIPHELTWEHYRNLLTVKDGKERKILEEKVIRGNWNSTKLREYLSVKRKLAAPADDDKPVAQLKFTRGKLHTCQIVPANKTLIRRGPLAIDLGFREQYEIPQDAPKLKENDTVELVFGSASGGKDGTLIGARKVEAPKDEMFTYKAAVEKVIDGDTLLVSRDFPSPNIPKLASGMKAQGAPAKPNTKVFWRSRVGFGGMNLFRVPQRYFSACCREVHFGCPMSVSWKLRLRGIDCPEIDTEEGKRAKRFVESRLKDCDFIIVKTYKDRTDKFDRYLADIFYESSDIRRQSSETDDRRLKTDDLIYLNQELLNERLAKEYV